MKQQRRQHYFRNITLLLLVVLTATYGYVAYNSPLPALAAQPVLMNRNNQSTDTLPWPSYGGSAIGAVGYGVLATHGNAYPIPTASTAKMMTALAVLQKHPLSTNDQGPTITLTQTDVDYYNAYWAEDGSVVKVVAGEKITEYQAIEAMLLPSANNMAETLAVWAFGSQQKYDDFANSYAKTLGMESAHFADASGFSPNTIATAGDLVLLGEASMEHPALAHIVNERTADVPVAGTINNVNWELGEHGINGIKTGSTDQDGGAYIYSAPKTYPNGQTITIVGVIIGAKLLNTAMRDSLPLIDAAEQNFSPSTVIAAGQVVGSYSVPWDIDVDAIAAKSLILMSWHGKTASTHLSLQKIRAPFAKGMTVGVITADADPDQKISVTIKHAVEAPHWYWRTFRKL